MTAIIGALWIAFTYVQNQKAQAHQEMAARLKESQVRLLEAQKSFLDKKMQTFFETADVAGKIINATPNSSEWNELWQRFWSLRWSEMEMVGTPDIRERMRSVAEAASILHKKPINEADFGEAHYLRWMVECLADQLRAAAESSWQTEVAYVKPTLPGGCYAGFEELPEPRFVPHPAGQEPARTPAR